MSNRRSVWLVCGLLIVTALAFRLVIARYLANDEPYDGKVYAQIARNVLEQHTYSHSTEPPYEPSLIRLPGYPLFLAAIYSVFGHNNNTAVRIAQALLDTASCVLVALLAFQWEPDKKRKRATAIAALALAAVCPFTAIYVGTILTETPTIFFALAICLSATLAFQAQRQKRSLALWAVTGLIGGIGVMFRPDSGLFAAAIGITLVVFFFVGGNRDPVAPPKGLRTKILTTLLFGAVLSTAFCLTLVPWTLRNERVFHVFQPLAPAHAEMPGEFVARGYLAWLRTWIDDERYVGPVLWSLDESPISLDDIPDAAFDSPEEKQQVSALLERYNHPPEDQTATSTQPPQAGPGSGSGEQTTPPSAPTTEAAPSEENQAPEEETQGEESDESANEENQVEESQAVQMTPEIDAGFAAIARERIQRSPIRYYFWLPVRRGIALWFDTHSQYYPFEGQLLPFEDLDYEIHQQLWLPLFVGLTWIYTLLGAAGGWLLWRLGDLTTTRRWVLMAALLIFLRIGFFATLENPEPRYVVEVFPFLSVLGGIAIGQLLNLRTAIDQLPKLGEKAQS